ncbi:MAG: hypothetical protein ACXW2C_01125 [Acidimicrobiia bacterium]
MRDKIASAVIIMITVGAFAGPAGASTRADRATARSLVVRAADLTGNWTSGPPDAADSDASDKAAARCLGVKKDPNARRDAHVEGPGLTRADGYDVQSSGNVFESRAALRASLSLFDRPKLSTCLERRLRENLREDYPDATVDAFTLVDLPVTIPGVQARAFRITVTVTDGGESATIVSDEILAWRGRLGSSATITGANGALPNDLESEVATVLGQRLIAAT